MTDALRVRGLKELTRDLRRASPELARELREELKAAGAIVAAEARDLFSPIDANSASSFRPRVRGRGLVVVEQRKRRTTGRHAQYGSLQMRRALLPAVAAKTAAVERRIEEMLDRLGRHLGF